MSEQIKKSEDRIQQECYMWFHNTYPELRGLLFAVPNGGRRSPQEAKKFKLTGVVPGVSDMLFMYMGNTYCFELKTPIGTQSNNQIVWQELVVKHMFSYFVVRSKDQFEYLINGIIKGSFNLKI